MERKKEREKERVREIKSERTSVNIPCAATKIHLNQKIKINKYSFKN